MRLVKILIVALGLMAIAATAGFAAVPFTTTSTLNQMATNAQTGLAGTIQLTALAGGTTAVGESVIVTFNGGQISSLSDMVVSVTGANAGTTGAAGSMTAYSTAYTLTGISGIKVTITNSSVVLSFPAAVTFAANDIIQIVGTRLNVSSSAVAGGSLSANLSSTLASITVTNPTVPVATFLAPITASGVTVASISTNGTVITATGSVKVTELFGNAFETKGATSPTQLTLRISNIPTGITLTTVSATASGSTNLITVAIPATGSVTQTGSTATALVNITAQDATVNESITATLTFAVSGTATFPLTIQAATVAATLGPAAPATIGTTPVPVDNVTLGDSLRYLAVYTSPEITVLNVTQLSTRLLAQYVTWSADIPGQVDSGYDTGITISNTTGYGFAGDIGGAAGNIVATLFPADGSASKTVTTSATVFNNLYGLDGSGQIPPHGTFVVLASTLAQQAGFTTGFTGQVVFTIATSNAHGMVYLADRLFQKLSQGFPMLVMQNYTVGTPRTVGVTGTNEGLGN